MFVISNTRYPIADVKLRYPDGTFYSLSRGWNNMWAANGGPFTFPITIQARCCCFPQSAADKMSGLCTWQKHRRSTDLRRRNIKSTALTSLVIRPF